MPHSERLSPPRSRCFEQFEDRLALSAQPVADIIYVPQIIPGIEQQVQTEQFPSSQSTIQDIRQQYGFDGRGQTVAVIDSGIAWDHYALGNGFGSGQRVVGGWDFAENDANPYDDGAAGFHGTHVSGIIASEESNYQGVASGVDLVGLRVFDDQGMGKMEWVEQALQWVHSHRDDFANPITTVNLSLGSDWNSDSVPNWATLENELAQLELDGIFVSVAAGNSFSKYETAGLAYPAASSHVVPVASHGADGNLSSFSQRNDRVLVAPGESIKSTVPDHLFGGSKTGQFLGASGTSMAAPYVAGASALLREAYEFIGIDSVTQQQLYEQFFNSADKIYDHMTAGWYSRINIAQALDSVIGDAEGDTWETSTSLGVLSGGLTIHGTIGRADDTDTFEFRAGKTGVVTLAFETTHDLQALVTVYGGSAQWSNNILTLNVVAGQDYKFSVETLEGIGHYKIDAKIAGSLNAVQWGTVYSSNFDNQSIIGQATFQMTAGRDGLLTVVANVNSGAASFKLLDAGMREIGTISGQTGRIRIDADVNQGDVIFLRSDGNANVDLRVANLVSSDGGHLTINGTNSQDNISVVAAEQFEVQINGLNYSFSKASTKSISVYGHQGHDLFTATLSSSNDQVVMARGAAFLNSGEGWTLAANGMHSATVFSGGGNDVVSMLDSSRDDRLFNDRSIVAMQGQDFANYSVGFRTAYAFGTSGIDEVEFTGSNGDDVFFAGDRSSRMQTGTQTIHALGFGQVRVDGGGGRDLAILKDSIANDSFVFGPGYATAQINESRLDIRGVSQINAQATGGNDTAKFYDSSGDDRFVQNSSSAQMSGAGYDNRASGFDDFKAYATTGADVAQLTDSRGDDTAWMQRRETTVAGDLLRTYVAGFKRVNLITNQGGFDTVHLRGTAGQDTTFSDVTGTGMQTAGGALNRVVGAVLITVDGWGGTDYARMVGTSGVERFVASPNQTELQRGANRVTVRSVGSVSFDGNGGADEVVFAQLDQNDLLLGAGNQAKVQIDSQTVNALNFAVLEANSVDGATANYELASVDYLFMLEGSWKKK